MEMILLEIGLVVTCYTMAKKMPTFCPCPKTMGDWKLKGDTAVYLVEEIWRQHSTQAMAWDNWLLLASYSKNWEQSRGRIEGKEEGGEQTEME